MLQREVRINSLKGTVAVAEASPMGGDVADSCPLMLESLALGPPTPVSEAPGPVMVGEALPDEPPPGATVAELEAEPPIAEPIIEVAGIDPEEEESTIEVGIVPPMEVSTTEVAEMTPLIDESTIDEAPDSRIEVSAMEDDSDPAPTDMEREVGVEPPARSEVETVMETPPDTVGRLLVVGDIDDIELPLLAPDPASKVRQAGSSAVKWERQGETPSLNNRTSSQENQELTGQTRSHFTNQRDDCFLDHHSPRENTDTV